MKWLDKRGATQWKITHEQFVDPYRDGCNAKIWIQFEAPAEYTTLECIVKCFLAEVLCESEEFLVDFVDWSPSQTCRDLLIEALRLKSCGIGQLQNSPACLCTSAEMDWVMALFVLSSCFEWKAYLYGSHGNTGLYNWEGEIWDFWTDSDAHWNKMNTILESFGLRIIKER